MENVIAEEFRSSGRKAAFAAKRAGRNIACIAGMLVIELALLLMVLLTGQAGGIERIVVDAILLAGQYSVFGLIRVMHNKTFLIHVKFNDPAASPFPIWVYVVIEAVSIILLTNPILEGINEAVSGMYDDLIVLTNDQVMLLGIGMLAASVFLAIASGLLICIVVKFLKRHVRIY